ncbi:hypothetical protein HU200_045230 [Digitaria exilis]|uniref:Uncharacterized protein n=1 Tax=Digitaria exilis TaxID=1010633 RepID=A0A835EFS2_9POAL|nr:hypothetical protein HU200_045230 [Digitaria exilis]
MAAARRLSELLQEQQEPFLVEVAKARRPRRSRGGSSGGGLGCCPADACRRLLRLCNHGFKKRKSGGSACGGGGGAAFGSGLRSALSKVLCSRAMRRVLRWEDLGAGCFSGAGSCGGREFRRLRRSLGDSGECDPRAMVFAEDDEERMGWKADMDVDSSRQLSPVSVLDLHSDDDESSPVHSGWEDEKPSTSGSSPPSEPFLGPASPCFSFSYNLHDKFCEMEVDEAEDETGRSGRSIEEQITSWEKIAGDISRIPAMMELDLSRSMRQWRELKPEVSEIGDKIETLIFEDIRRETVCDMLASHCTLAAAATSC